MTDLRIAVTVRENGHVQARRLDNNVASSEFPIGYHGVNEQLVTLFERWLMARHRQWREDEIRVFGSHLHRCLFAPELWNWIEPLITQTTARGDLARLELIFPAEGTYARLSVIPWEFLYRPSNGQNEGYFLAASDRIILSRYIPSVAGEPRTKPPVKLRVLVVVSDPDPYDTGTVLWQEVEASIKRICANLQFPYDMLENPTLDALGAHLRPRETRPHLIHIIGHGTFDTDAGEATLALPDGQGGVDWVSDRRLSAVLTRGGTPPRTVILHSCELGRADYSASFAGMPPQLIRKGVSRVIAMQYPIENGTAIDFSTRIYESLDRREDLDLAVSEARWQISTVGEQPDPRLLGVPVMYVRESNQVNRSKQTQQIKSGGGVYDFRITLTRETVRCEYDTPVSLRNACPEERLKLDPHLETIRTFEYWIGRWERIAKLDNNQNRYLVPSTFSVLGTQLWNLAFSGHAGRELMVAYEALSTAPEGAKPQVRVRISFATDAGELAALPWEFLRAPAGGGSYLAIQTDLVLGRFVDGLSQSVSPRQADDKVRVLFITTLPNDRDSLKDERDQLDLLVKDLRNLAHVQVEPVNSWNLAEIDTALGKLRQTGGPVDIVHLVALCRLKGNKLELLLPVDSNTSDYIDPQQVVSHLTGLPDNRPQLVVLHVVDDWNHRDLSDHFEQLAPAFIKAQASAVLAMQYAMPPDIGRGFVKSFYAQLALGQTGGRAVQTARFELSRTGTNRRFGTPVLYLQSAVDPQLVRRTIEDGEQPGSSGDITPVIKDKPAIRPDITRDGGEVMRRKLLAILDAQPAGTPGSDWLRSYIQTTNWPENPRAAKVKLRIDRRNKFDDTDIRVLAQLLVDKLDEPARDRR
ncbi:MAG: CHAT domain-containing protein [Jatrophihabitantaceae bacterium]